MSLVVVLLINFALTGIVYNLTSSRGTAVVTTTRAECTTPAPEKGACHVQQLQRAEEAYQELQRVLISALFLMGYCVLILNASSCRVLCTDAE